MGGRTGESGPSVPAGSRPVARIAVAVLEEIDPQAHAQRQVSSTGEHGIDAVGRRRKVVEHADQPAGRDVVLDRKSVV